MTRLLKVGLILLFLTLCWGCSNETRTVYIRQTVPEALLVETPAPTFTGKTNADLVDYLGRQRDALAQCNADKLAVKTTLAKKKSNE